MQIQSCDHLEKKCFIIVSQDMSVCVGPFYESVAFFGIGFFVSIHSVLGVIEQHYCHRQSKSKIIVISSKIEKHSVIDLKNCQQSNQQQQLHAANSF